MTHPLSPALSDVPEVLMGVSVEGAGGRGRSGVADLNVVPFIDLLSVMIVFLVATAVWISVQTLQVDQAVSDGTATTPADPPLTVHVERGSLAVARGDVTATLPDVDGQPDWDALGRALDADRAAHPEARAVVIVTDDGRPYGDMIGVLDVAKARGFDQPLLGGRP